MSESHIPRSLRNQVEREQQPVTIAQCREWIAAGVIAGTTNVYNQLGAQSSEHFEKLEGILRQQIEAELERRSWRGRWNRLTARVMTMRMIAGRWHRLNLRVSLPVSTSTLPRDMGDT